MVAAALESAGLAVRYRVWQSCRLGSSGRLAAMGKGAPVPQGRREAPHSSPQERHAALAQDLVVKRQFGRPVHHPQAHMEG